MMRLQLVRGGSFFTVADDAACRILLDAKVWSKLPEEMIWQVLLLLPAAKQFQLQLVSRKWRQVLTSTHFRNRVMAAAAAAAAAPREWEQQQQQQQQQQQRVVAWVRGDSTGNSQRSRDDLKVVEIKLSGFVPTRFWICLRLPHWYSVTAVGDGLVCICNDSELHSKLHSRFFRDSLRWMGIIRNSLRWMGMERDSETVAPTNRYCVLNPLTRTCVMLPQPPFQADKWYPPTSTGTGGFTISVGSLSGTTWELATYHHPPTGGAAGGWVVAKPMANLWAAAKARPPAMARLGGETYRYGYGDGRVHVLAPAAGEAGEVEVEVEVSAMNAPAPTYQLEASVLVPHSGAVYFVAQIGMRFPFLAFGVWRLTRQRMEWESVARLCLREVQLLTSIADFVPLDLELDDAYAVRGLLCCQLRADIEGRRCLWLLGHDLDTGKWELVHREEHMMPANLQWKAPTLDNNLQLKVMELRPDLFLSPADSVA